MFWTPSFKTELALISIDAGCTSTSFVNPKRCEKCRVALYLGTLRFISLCSTVTRILFHCNIVISVELISLLKNFIINILCRHCLF